MVQAPSKPLVVFTHPTPPPGSGHGTHPLFSSIWLQTEYNQCRVGVFLDTCTLSATMKPTFQVCEVQLPIKKDWCSSCTTSTGRQQSPLDSLHGERGNPRLREWDGPIDRCARDRFEWMHRCVQDDMPDRGGTWTGNIGLKRDPCSRP
jgi:hypothetical protein